MGGAIISVIAAIAVAANSADEHKKDVGVEVVLRDYAEAIMGGQYNGCTPPAYSYTAPSGYALSAPVVTGCYDGTSTSGGYTGGVDKGAVRLRLEVHSTDTSANHFRTKTLEIVKAADYARPS